MTETLPPERQLLIGAEDFHLSACEKAGGEMLPKEPIWFDAILYPHRSLSPGGFWAVMLVVVAVNVVSAAYYFTIGAWPIVIFTFVDVLIVWWAFRISYAQGRLRERVILVDDRLEIYRVDPKGLQSCWRLPAGWVRLAYDKPMKHEGQIRLYYKGGLLLIGSFLSPPERGDLARALEKALQQCRQGVLLSQDDME